MYIYIYIYIHIYMYIYISVTGTKFGLRKRQWASSIAMVTGILAVMPAYAQMTYGISSAHVQWSSHGKSRVDNYDIIWWCHNDCSCFLGREVYKESSLRLWGYCLGFWHWMVRSIVKSLTLYSSYIGASSWNKKYIQDELSSLFIHLHSPILFWEPL